MENGRTDELARDAEAGLHGRYALHTGEAPDAELVWGDDFFLAVLTARAGVGPP